MSKKTLSLLVLFSIIAMMVAGCGPTPEPEVIVETVVVETEKEVVVTKEVEKEVVVTKEVEKEVQVEVTKEVIKEVPVEVVVREAGPDAVLDLILIQHALCAWDAFWCTVEAGIYQAADDMNVNVTVLGPDAFDLEKVAQLIDQAVAAQPDGIALTVSDPDLFREPIQRALDAGIPVVAYNAGSGPIEDGIDYMTYLGQDEYAGGYLGGLKLAAEGGTKGVCINHQVGHTGLDARCNGFATAMEENGIPTEVLATTNDPAESQTIIDDYFTANPDADIFMTMGPNSANPFYAFMEAAGLAAGDVQHGTFDLSDEIIAKIKDGTTMFGIDQQPFLQGYGAVQALMLKVRQGISPALPVTPTGPGFVDASNVAVVERLAGEYR
jgi:simple sugar transport system substrate-binding protein